MSSNKPPSCRRGFTLIEMLVSLSAATVLFLGLSSATLIASRALPQAHELGIQDREVINLINQIRNELNDSNRVVISEKASATVCEIYRRLAQDHLPQKIVYTFDKSDNQITRTIDSNTPEIVLDQVRTCTFDTRTDSARIVSLTGLIEVKDTIQKRFEFHQVFPSRPEAQL